MPIVMQFRAAGNPASVFLGQRPTSTPATAPSPDPDSLAETLSPAATGPSSSAAGPAASVSTPATGTPTTTVDTPPASSAPLAAAPPPPKAAEDVALWLPSALPATLRNAALPPSLIDKERRLRLAQADDALEDIRRIRRIIMGITEFRRLNVTGTGQKTGLKVRSLYMKFQDKCTLAAERYRAARAALEALDHGGEWEGRFKILQDKDIRGPGRDDEDFSSEGRYQISWIWLVPRGPGQAIPTAYDVLDPKEFLENMRSEWARSQARGERWGEETQLLEEEMRRVIEYFEWKAAWWRQQATRRPNVEPALTRGLKNYAEKQACIFDGLALRCATLWIPYLRQLGGEMPQWSDRYHIPQKKDKQKAQEEPRFTGSSTALDPEPDSDSDTGSETSSSDEDEDEDL